MTELSQYTSLRVGGPATKIVQVSTEAQIIAAIEEAGETPILIMGGGTNVLIADKGFDKKYGARPLKRAIQKYIEDALAEEIITSHVQDGDSIIMDLDEKSQELKIKIEKAEKPAES